MSVELFKDLMRALQHKTGTTYFTFEKVKAEDVERRERSQTGLVGVVTVSLYKKPHHLGLYRYNEGANGYARYVICAAGTYKLNNTKGQARPF